MFPSFPNTAFPPYVDQPGKERTSQPPLQTENRYAQSSPATTGPNMDLPLKL